MTPPSSADDGVLTRLITRTKRTIPVPLLGAVAIVVIGWGPPGAFDDVTDMVIGIVLIAMCVGVVPVLVHRIRLWTVAGQRASEWPAGTGWAKARCGAPQLLHAPRGPFSLGRKQHQFPQQMLSIRTPSGPLSAGPLLIVHARSDGLLPQRNDPVFVLALGRRGPFLIGRPDDGALFVADQWKSATP